MAKMTKMTDGLDDRQDKHLAAIIEQFGYMATIQYVKGAREHGGNLLDMSDTELALNAMEEIADAFEYLATLVLRQQGKIK